MTTKENWDSLLKGTINGHAVNETRTANVWAMGAPTVELWKDSWNASYPNEMLYIRYDEQENPYVLLVGNEGSVSYTYYDTDYGCAFRPIIRLPSSVLNQ